METTKFLKVFFKIPIFLIKLSFPVTVFYPANQGNIFKEPWINHRDVKLFHRQLKVTKMCLIF
jgi:hypothetical protein